MPICEQCFCLKCRAVRNPSALLLRRLFWRSADEKCYNQEESKWGRLWSAESWSFWAKLSLGLQWYLHGCCTEAVYWACSNVIKIKVLWKHWFLVKALDSGCGYNPCSLISTLDRLKEGWQFLCVSLAHLPVKSGMSLPCKCTASSWWWSAVLGVFPRGAKFFWGE